MQEMITQKENENAVKEILERLYYNDIVECDGEISSIGKFLLLQALIENHLKMELPYACKKMRKLSFTRWSQIHLYMQRSF